MTTGKRHFQSAARWSLLAGLVVVSLLGLSGSAYAGISTFAADCTTPKTVFNLGDAVCARATGLAGFRFAWVDPDGFIVQKTDIASDPQDDAFTAPATAQSSIAGLFTANNLGTWRVTAVTSRNSVKSGAFFTVRDPANARVDLTIVNSILGSTTPAAGDPIQFAISISNSGPDDAADVHFVDQNFTNATFVSISQTGGPSFACSGADCTIASFPNGAVATFVLNFTAGSAGGTLENTAAVSSTTADLNPNDNTSTAAPVKVGSSGTPPTCSIDCPNNMVVSANATQNSQPGAFVTFATPDAFGDCGPVVVSPASGSFFAVGSTTVNVSASGGGFCSFTVTVIQTPPPTISCPADITVTALSGQTSAFVPDPNGIASNPGNATATGSNVSVFGERSDQLSLSDAYPIGVTTITWTATDDGGRSVHCTQKITVISPDAPKITCPADKTFNAPSGSCSVTVSASDLGTPSTVGPSVTVTSTRSDGQPLLAPFPAGDTIVTWTATNAFGVASCNQNIHVNATDTQPPALTVPSDVVTTTTTCSAVLDDELGVATATDNCSVNVPIVRTGVPANFVFPTGTTIVTYTATDAAGNKTVGTQRVTVLESPAVRPTVSAPPDVSVGTGAGAATCGAAVSDTALGSATASDNCPGVTVTRTGVPAGNIFPVGTTVVTYTATDASGNTAAATQRVVVTDTTPPAITCPPSVTLEPTCPTGAVASWTAPVGTDNCPGAVTTQTGGPVSGSVFPTGTTAVSYSVRDASGNQTSCSFTVTVLTVVQAIHALETSVAGSSLNRPQSQGLLPKLDSALDSIGKGHTNAACQNLADFIQQVQNFINNGMIPADQGQAWITSATHVRNALGCTNAPCS